MAEAAPSAREVWSLLNEVVRDSRREWTRLVSAEAGMPYSRVRALRALAERDLTMSELARQVVVDAPAATGILNDLEGRGLARRSASAESRRVRIASITPAGRELVDRVHRIEIPRPPALDRLGAEGGQF
ncbi:MarR family winged helix-turn-helix transcriptional regulator, partial [Mesorhizobium japonicum]|uniref:MarR family winged helix-turn-helix transcriptional regulator n=1 Tax=Mesorhizobium japonicum TaxID=2066070 RepID=UPI003B5CEF48